MIVTSIRIDGIFPIVLASIKLHFPIEVIAAPAVTRPDGTKGRSQKKIIDINTNRKELLCILIQ